MRLLTLIFNIRVCNLVIELLSIVVHKAEEKLYRKLFNDYILCLLTRNLSSNYLHLLNSKHVFIVKCIVQYLSRSYAAITFHQYPRFLWLISPNTI